MIETNSEVEVSVVLPCFNEKGNILPLISAIQKELATFTFEIVVVDDNSPDGTFDHVRDANLAYVRVFQRENNPSLALSIEEGIRHCRGENIVVMDSDFNHRPQDLKILISNLAYYDCVIASRFVYGGDMGNRFRHMSSWLFNIFTRMMVGTYITDSLFGYFAIKRSTLNTIPFDKIFWGYGDYCIRLLYYLQKQNTPILQIPGVLGKRLAGEGNTRLFKTLIQYSIEVLKLAITIRRRKK